MLPGMTCLFRFCSRCATFPTGRQTGGRNDRSIKVSRLTAITEQLAAGGFEALVGVQALVREMEATDPGSMDRLRDNLVQRRLVHGLAAFARR